MSLATLEAAILLELREIVKNHKLRKKDMLEWSTGGVEPGPDEIVIDLPKIGVSVSIFKALDRR